MEPAAEPLDAARDDDAIAPAQRDRVVQPAGEPLGQRAGRPGQRIDELGRRAHELRVGLVETAEHEDLAGRERDRARVGPRSAELPAHRPRRAGARGHDDGRADDSDEDDREQECLPQDRPPPLTAR